MAVTKIDITNRALVLVGSNKISSFTDSSTEANVADELYEEYVESILTRSRWDFATEQQQLSLLADAPTGRYEYAYQMPSSPAVIQIHTVTVNDFPIQYERYGNKIFVNGYGSNSLLVMDYIFRPDESTFPPYFRHALIYKLASAFAGSIARDAALVNQFDTLAERQILIARNTESQESTSNRLNTDKFLTNRWSTRSGKIGS
tara:strand:- start:392 stop:1000 length:609 start_codon:yes stop_codon:yes gene_type:complete